jgi:hypothetical protein
MKFFVSKHDNLFMLYITNEFVGDRHMLLNTLRDYFGPWMFLGVREYTKTEFLQLFAKYIPNYVLEQIDSTALSIYKAELILK